MEMVRTLDVAYLQFTEAIIKYFKNKSLDVTKVGKDFSKIDYMVDYKLSCTFENVCNDILYANGKDSSMITEAVSYVIHKVGLLGYKGDVSDSKDYDVCEDRLFKFNDCVWFIQPGTVKRVEPGELTKNGKKMWSFNKACADEYNKRCKRNISLNEVASYTCPTDANDIDSIRVGYLNYLGEFDEELFNACIVIKAKENGYQCVSRIGFADDLDTGLEFGNYFIGIDNDLIIYPNIDDLIVNSGLDTVVTKSYFIVLTDTKQIYYWAEGKSLKESLEHAIGEHGVNDNVKNEDIVSALRDKLPSSMKNCSNEELVQFIRNSL